MSLDLNHSIQCPKCNGKDFVAKYKSTYLYTYQINTSESDIIKDEEHNLPFLFDNREQCNSEQYIECKECGSQFPCHFQLNGERIKFTILRKAIRADHVEEPQFWG